MGVGQLDHERWGRGLQFSMERLFGTPPASEDDLVIAMYGALGVLEGERVAWVQGLEPLMGQLVAVGQVVSPEKKFDDLVLVVAERDF